MKKNRKNLIALLVSLLTLVGILVCTVFANESLLNGQKELSGSLNGTSSKQAQTRPESMRGKFDIDKAAELISKYYDCKSVVEYDPNEFLCYLGLKSKSVIERNYEIDNTSWVPLYYFDRELENYFSYELVYSDFVKHYEVLEFDGDKMVNYYGKQKSERKKEYVVSEVESLKKFEDDAFSCRAKVTSNNGPISEVFVKEFKFIFYNNKYQLAKIV